MSPIWSKGIAELAAAYRAGDLDPVAATRAFLARIAEIDGTLNCFVAMNPTLEAEAAQSARRLRDGTPRSALEGVPIAVKDNLAAAGMPVTWGSALFADDGPCAADELPVARLRAAGALILGKTNTPEFAVEGYTHNRLFGTTGNAWDPGRTPGGSSGGSVSAVAAGMAAAAIGTDGGGSIRRPAGYCGLYGLKPGIGTVPRAGGLPQVLLDFEVVGGLARSMPDLALLHAVMAGPDRRDPLSLGAVAAVTPARPLCILYVPRLGDNPCDPGILECCAAAAARLAGLGHHVEEGEMPFALDTLNAFWPRFGQVGLARLLRERPEMAQKASPPYLAMAETGAAVPVADFAAALEEVRALRAAASVFLAEWDAIMTPSSAAQPWPAAEPFPPEIGGQPVGPRGHAVYTGWVNAAGLPALNLPADPHPGDGLPVGFQLVAGHGGEALLLALGAAYEAAGPGWRWPGWLAP